jgi:hypothetical protein
VLEEKVANVVRDLNLGVVNDVSIRPVSPFSIEGIFEMRKTGVLLFVLLLLGCSTSSPPPRGIRRTIVSEAVWVGRIVDLFVFPVPLELLETFDDSFDHLDPVREFFLASRISHRR